MRAARRDSGQILVVFAMGLVVLLGFAALVVDVGLNYAQQRRYQSVADGASLAGAQELKPTSRSAPVTSLMQELARTRALEAVADELIGDGTLTSCDPTADIVDCDLPGGRYRVSIQTPSPTCVSCVPERAVQVTVSEPRFSTIFARVLGQSTWDVRKTSVAGLSFGRQYTIVTLRPPQPNGMGGSFDVRDIRIEGGTIVRVNTGDVATNSNMVYNGAGSILQLDAGYRMFYFDPYNGPKWAPPNPANPTGEKLGSLVDDPGYVIPTSSGGPTGAQDTDEAAGSACATAASELLADPGYEPYVPITAPATPDMDKIDCYLPGVYTTTLEVDNGDLAILEPGLYWLGGGMDAQGSVIGGWSPGTEGVALVFRSDGWTSGGSGEFKNRTTGGGTDPHAVSLNAGTRFGDLAGGVEATAAMDFAGNPVVTNGDPPIKMTVMVDRDVSCIVEDDPYPACASEGKTVFDASGGSALYLAGVQFMPTDNVQIRGSSGSVGYVGQIWAWTVQYSGDSVITQEGLVKDDTGIMRIDTACSPGTACN
jgi:Flp pilus assembly protein TadG